MRASICIATVLLFGCQPEKKETTTRGNLHVLFAESVAPAMIAEVDAFQSLYEKNGSHVTYEILTAQQVNSRFVLDTTKVIATTIPLDSKEQDLVRKTSGTLVEVTIAYDGLALITSPRNPCEKITKAEIRDLLGGKTKRWEELTHANGAHGQLKLTFQDSSDITAFIDRRLMDGFTFPKLSRRTTSSLQTVALVEHDPLALGFVGLPWLDSVKGRVKPLKVATSKNDADTAFSPAKESVGEFYGLHPAYLHLNYYPLKRAIWLYTRSMGGDVAAGFSSFVSTFEGQQILFQHGLLPGTQQIKIRRPGIE